MQKKARPQSVFLCVFLWNCPERRRKPGSNDRGKRSPDADHRLHLSLRGPSGPWQSPGTDGREIAVERYCPEISGLALSLCPALRLCKGKCLPNRCGRLTPPQAALPCGPRRLRLLAMTSETRMSLRGPEGAAAIRTPCRQCPQERTAKRTDCHVGLRPPRNDSNGRSATSLTALAMTSDGRCAAAGG